MWIGNNPVGWQQPPPIRLWLQTEMERLVEDYQLLIDLHKSANRQGPGSDAETEKALGLSMIDQSAPLKIADIGCGTGASTLLLARLLKAQITAVDFLQEFLEELEDKAQNIGLSEKITTLSCSMDRKSLVAALAIFLDLTAPAC